MAGALSGRRKLDCVSEIKAIAPARIRPGLVHFALAVGGFAIGTTEFATMSLLRYFARDLHIDEPAAAHVISSYALGAAVGAPTTCDLPSLPSPAYRSPIGWVESTAGA